MSLQKDASLDSSCNSSLVLWWEQEDTWFGDGGEVVCTNRHHGVSPFYYADHLDPSFMLFYKSIYEGMRRTFHPQNQKVHKVSRLLAAMRAF